MLCRKKFKPCPFCGNKGLLKHKFKHHKENPCYTSDSHPFTDAYDDKFYIQCSSCKSKGPIGRTVFTIYDNCDCHYIRIRKRTMLKAYYYWGVENYE